MSVADILQALAENAGQAQLRKGAIYGNLISSASQLPLQISEDRDRQRAVALANARAKQQMDLERSRAAREDQQARHQDTADAHAALTEQHLGAIIGAGFAADPTTFDQGAAVTKAQALGRPDLIPTVAAVHEKFQPKLSEHDPTKALINPTGGVVVPAVPKPVEPTTAGLEARQLFLLSKQKSGVPITPEEQSQLDAYTELKAPKTPVPAPPRLGDLADYLTRYAKEHNKKPEELTTAELAIVTKQHTDATQKTPMLGGMNALYADIDPKAIASQIRAGQHPPDISQYGRPAAAAVASELAKKGPNGEAPFDLSSAQREWKAQINLNRTMNGAQQVRLDESIRSGLAMYDKVDELASQWDGKGWGPLSRLNLSAAREGLKGPQAQSIANQLTGQIGQLTSDVATIEQGGLTPTNESRAIAEKSMQDWWGKGTIKDMTAQGRYNMQVRHMARQTQEPMAPGNAPATTPAAPATPGGAPGRGVTVTSSSGKSYAFPDQATADRFVADAKAKGLWK